MDKFCSRPKAPPAKHAIDNADEPEEPEGAGARFPKGPDVNLAIMLTFQSSALWLWAPKKVLTQGGMRMSQW